MSRRARRPAGNPGRPRRGLSAQPHGNGKSGGSCGLDEPLPDGCGDGWNGFGKGKAEGRTSGAGPRSAPPDPEADGLGGAVRGPGTSARGVPPAGPRGAAAREAPPAGRGARRGVARWPASAGPSSSSLPDERVAR